MKDLLSALKRVRAYYCEHRRMEKAKTKGNHIHGINSTVLYGRDLKVLLAYALRAYRLEVYIQDNAHRKTLPREEVEAILHGKKK